MATENRFRTLALEIHRILNKRISHPRNLQTRPDFPKVKCTEPYPWASHIPIGPFSDLFAYAKTHFKDPKGDQITNSSGIEDSPRNKTLEIAPRKIALDGIYGQIPSFWKICKQGTTPGVWACAVKNREFRVRKYFKHLMR